MTRAASAGMCVRAAGRTSLHTPYVVGAMTKPPQPVRLLLMRLPRVTTLAHTSLPLTTD